MAKKLVLAKVFQTGLKRIFPESGGKKNKVIIRNIERCMKFS
jgi:hypothetical protein